MTKQKVGLILFWIGAIYAFVWGVLASISVGSAFRASTIDELSQTVWAFTGFWHLSWAFSPPFGALVAGIGILLYSGARGSTVWKFGTGMFLGVFFGMVLTAVGHLPPLFGFGGALILLFFLGSLWFWTKERMALEGSSTTAADLKLAAYVFFLIAAWFMCGVGSQPFMKALEEVPSQTPLHIMVFLVLGWLCLFLSHYRTGQQRGPEGP